MVIFISKINLITTFPILHLSPMRAHNPPYCQKRVTLLSFGILIKIICIHSCGFCYPEIVVWACGAHNIATELQVTVQVYRFGHSGLVQVAVNCLYRTQD